MQDEEHRQARFTLLVLIESIAVAVLTALVVMAAWVRLAPATATSDRPAAARLARVTLWLGFLIAYGVLGRRVRPPFFRACGFAPAVRPIRAYVTGFVAGVLPVVALIGLLIILGARWFEIRADPAKLSWICTKYVLLAIPLVALEEGLFRGLLLGDFVRAIGSRAGIALCSLFFAVTHFLGASDAWRSLPVEIQSGPDVVLAVFAGMARMLVEWPELVGLFLVGMILSIVRLRTGQLYLGMGIHAGWYWVKQIDRYFVREVDAVIEPNQLWLGSSQYLDGVLGWVALLTTLFIVQRVGIPSARLADART